MVDTQLRDTIPEFGKKAGAAKVQAGVANMPALSAGPGARTVWEIAAIVLVAVVIIGGAEIALRLLAVPSYVLPTPSEVIVALFTDWQFIGPHLVHTLIELFSGYAIGASIGLLLAAVITQFPFAEKIIAPYILMLVTTPMLALVPLLMLNFGFGYTPRIIAVALASGPMVMINSATGFRRTDLAKIALARSFGASTMQIFMKIRVPMALIRAGVKLAALIPSSSADSVNEELRKKGIKFDIGSLKAEDLDPLIDALQDLEVDVKNDQHKVRVFVE